MQNKTLIVDGMSCEHCSSSIRNACLKIEGVNSVLVDLGTKQVKIEFEDAKVTIDTIRETIEDQGYEIIV